MPADGVVPVSGTERGHDTRPGEDHEVDRSKPLRIAQANSVAWIDKNGGYHHGRLYVQPDGSVRFASEEGS